MTELFLFLTGAAFGIAVTAAIGSYLVRRERLRTVVAEVISVGGSSATLQSSGANKFAVGDHVVTDVDREDPTMTIRATCRFNEGDLVRVAYVGRVK